ncbi:hypothetical protein EXN66_Car012146 [Channa argus]|uniref:Uncharacterized protein n=1 Tax=Channa argus TaxID=215402 RepID=A0A6G1Q2H9_CHAAH|nr:hypothetical protein EXN66_Car012146 [Channa argus]
MKNPKVFVVWWLLHLCVSYTDGEMSSSSFVHIWEGVCVCVCGERTDMND